MHKKLFLILHALTISLTIHTSEYMVDIHLKAQGKKAVEAVLAQRYAQAIWLNSEATGIATTTIRLTACNHEISSLRYKAVLQRTFDNMRSDTFIISLTDQQFDAIMQENRE